TATVSTDRFLRTLGTGRAARSAWTALPESARGDINAYIAGVNEFIATHHGSRLPLEFTLLRFEPEPWTGPDVLAWVKMMAWDLSANYSFELLRRDLVRMDGVERMAELMPPYPVAGLSILATGRADESGSGGERAGHAGGAGRTIPVLGEHRVTCLNSSKPAHLSLAADCTGALSHA